MAGTQPDHLLRLALPDWSWGLQRGERKSTISRDNSSSGLTIPQRHRLPATLPGGRNRGFALIIRNMTNPRIDRSAEIEELVETAKGLAHPARLRILAMLTGGELCVCQMTAVLELAPSTVSQHLSVLSRGGLIADRKESKLVFYRLRQDGPAAALLTPLLDLFAQGAVASADRAVVARLRQIPIATICAAELGLAANDVRRAIAS